MSCSSSGIEDEIVADADEVEIADNLRAHVAATGHLITLKLLSVAPGPTDRADLRARVSCRAGGGVGGRSGLGGAHAHHGARVAVCHGAQVCVRVCVCLARICELLPSPRALSPLPPRLAQDLHAREDPRALLGGTHEEREPTG